MGKTFRRERDYVEDDFKKVKKKKKDVQFARKERLSKRSIANNMMVGGETNENCNHSW